MDSIEKISRHCEEVLNLSSAELSDEYYYQSLPLCVIDAVYSIGVRYSSTKQTVIRYCDYFNLKEIRDDKSAIPVQDEQQPISQFIEKMSNLGIERFTYEVFKNRQRTSTTNGILKSQAVYKFANALREQGVDYFQDVSKLTDNTEFESKIRDIPGQRSGISLKYFYMLAGFDNFIKPDRMVVRFLEETLEKKIEINQAQELLIKVTESLKNKYININPRLLDHEIWKYETR